jgi:hypothetical protein
VYWIKISKDFLKKFMINLSRGIQLGQFFFQDNKICGYSIKISQDF